MKARPAVRVRIALLLLFSSLLLCAGLSEIVLRLFFRADLAQPDGERSFLYRYDPQLGWFPPANSSREFTITRTVRVTHNSKGFRDIEPHPDNRPAIIFLGDSFVWGVDVEAEERLTEKLRSRHPDWNIYNFGVSGYGTDQELLLLQREFEIYHPRIVFLVYCCDNDMKDNSWNVRYGGYYKPFFEKTGGELRLRGIPVPKGERVLLTSHPLLAHAFLFRLCVRAYCRLTLPPRRHVENPTGEILKTLQSYVSSKGATLYAGITAPQPTSEQWLEAAGIPYINLVTTNNCPANGGHWTAAGHSDAADKIDAFVDWNLPGNLPLAPAQTAPPRGR